MRRYLLCIGLSLLCLFAAMAAPSTADQNASGQKPDYEVIYWESVKDSDNMEMYRAYLKRYPDGIFADLAKIKIKALASAAPGGGSPAVDRKKEAAPPAAVTRVQLRSKPEKILERDIRVFVKQRNFYDTKRNQAGDFNNMFIDNQDGTITDEATGLIWQKLGSTRRLDRGRANRYIKNLNWEKFAGRSDWRLPTVEELASLIESQPSEGCWLYIDPIFSDPNIACPDRCWSADKTEPIFGYHKGGWVISFWRGTIMGASWDRDLGNSANALMVNQDSYVRAVCSKPSPGQKY